MTRIPNYPKNRKERPEPLTSVVSEPAKLRRATTADNIRNIGNGIFNDVVLPQVKNLLWATFENFGRGLIFGQRGNVRPPGQSRATNFTRIGGNSYNAPYKANRRSSAPPPVLQFQDPVFTLRENAEKVLWDMQDAIEKYGRVTYGDLMNLSGISSHSPYRESVGWTNLAGVNIESYGSDWVLGLPDPKPLK